MRHIRRPVSPTGLRHSYSYDAEGNLTSVDGGAWSYGYDADGRRLRKCSGSCQSGTLYWKVGSQELAESDLAGNWTASYVPWESGKLARVDYPSGQVSYYFADRLGSNAVITDAAGIIKKETDYDPFGHEILQSGGDPNRYGFTGKELDNETGLNYSNARYYDSAAGRFTSPDPLSALPTSLAPQSLNAYAYARNNPLRFVDPTGLEETDTPARRQCNNYGNRSIPSGFGEVIVVIGSRAASWWGPVHMGTSRSNQFNGDRTSYGGGGGGPSGATRPNGGTETIIVNGYTDYNISGGYYLGATAGVVTIRGNPEYYYYGFGLTSPGVSGSITASPSAISPGWGVQFQVGYGVGISLGYGPFGNGSFYWESGIYSPGASLMIYDVKRL
jgi:RHS repeat-associated protein